MPPKRIPHNKHSKDIFCNIEQKYRYISIVLQSTTTKPSQVNLTKIWKHEMLEMNLHPFILAHNNIH